MTPTYNWKYSTNDGLEISGTVSTAEEIVSILSYEDNWTPSYLLPAIEAVGDGDLELTNYADGWRLAIFSDREED